MFRCNAFQGTYRKELILIIDIRYELLICTQLKAIVLNTKSSPVDVNP